MNDVGINKLFKLPIETHLLDIGRETMIGIENNYSPLIIFEYSFTLNDRVGDNRPTINKRVSYLTDRRRG